MQTAEANPSTKKDAWLLCDDDTKQYGRQLGEGVFEFKEKRPKWRGGQVQGVVTLADYNEERREHYASIYYGSLAGLKADCGEDWEWILAECIFEMTSY
jgi:hypothetical protein